MGADWEKRVKPGQTILVCDVGGGTSDFTLIRVRPAGKGKVMFHRVAVGEHLILGGDNLDLALAHHIESRLVERGKPKPDARQWGAVVRAARVVKETLLGKDAPDKTTVNIAGGGTKLVGSSVRLDLTRDEVERVLVDGFLPRVALEDKPAARRSGFQEFGLPFAPDAAITRYLAAFLSSHRELIRQEGIDGDHDPARPDLVLFNGGLFESPKLRERLLEVLTSWFEAGAPNNATEAKTSVIPRYPEGPRGGESVSPARGPSAYLRMTEGRGDRGEWSPVVLDNVRLDLSVARGAAYYGMVRRGKGVRIRGGLAHSYYLGVESAAGSQAVCLLPAGVEEGQTVDLPGRRFDLLIRQPAEFPLYYSGTRTTDRPGATGRGRRRATDRAAADPHGADQRPVGVGRHRVGRAAREADRDRHAGDLVFGSGRPRGRRTTNLAVAVRPSAPPARRTPSGTRGRPSGRAWVDEQTLSACRDLIRSAFRLNEPRPSGSGGPATAGPSKDVDKKAGSAGLHSLTVAARSIPPAGLVKQLESTTGQSRWEWPASLMRGFWETLNEVEAGRRLSVEHEARWLGLAGFSLRPGYGLAVDDWRVGQMWKLTPQELAFPKNEGVRAECVGALAGGWPAA